jgi:hypothetical protein
MMTREEADYVARKLVILEKLVTLLFVEIFRREKDPIDAAKAYAEVIREKTDALRSPRLSEADAMRFGEEVSLLFDDVLSELRQLKGCPGA